MTAENRANGSAGNLGGYVLSTSIFISTPDKPWDAEEKKAVCEDERKAFDWMTAEAGRFGVALRFERETQGLDSDIVLDRIPGITRWSPHYPYWVWHVLSKMGHKTPDEYWTAAQARGMSHAHVVLYANATGLAHALPFSPGQNPEHKFVEGCVVYREGHDGARATPPVIAHEIMHLYGAWDLYRLAGQSDYQDRAAERLFSNDIMRRCDGSLEKLTVGDLTAWRVGWRQRAEPWYSWMRPEKSSG